LRKARVNPRADISRLSARGKTMRFVLSLFVLVLSSVSVRAATSLFPLNPALESSEWKAVWIACPNAPDRDPGVFYFRKRFILKSVPTHFWIHVSADNRFILHVNGLYAGEGPARGDTLHWRFETIDLGPYLRKGNNTLAAVVWNFGTMSPLAQMSSRTAFLLQGDTAEEKAANTDRSWLVKQETGRTPMKEEQGAPYSSAGIGERIDGRLLDSSWDQAEVNKTAEWHAAVLVNSAATRGAEDSGGVWKLVPDQLPPMEHKLVSVGSMVRAAGISEAPSFPRTPLLIPAHKHVILLLDNKVLQTAYPELVISGGRNAMIQVTYAEALYDKAGQKGNRNQIAGRHIEGISDIFIGGGGSNITFEPLWWRTWRYLQLDITTGAEPLQLERFTAQFTAYPFVAKAGISGDIDGLDPIWATGWRTARLCAHETYMDAPYWEQLQYVADTRIEALISYTMSGDARLARQALEAIDDSRVSEGLTQSRYPSSVAQFIPPFSLLWVGMLHDYWMYVDDPQYVDEMVPHTRGIFDWYLARLRPDGLVDKVDWWNFGDWTPRYIRGVPPQEPDGESMLSTLQLIQGLKDAVDLERKFGSQQRAALYEEAIRKASLAINQAGWDKRYGLYADTPLKRTYSQQVNILAVLLDVAPRDQQASIMGRVVASQENEAVNIDGAPVPPMSQASYYFRFYLSRALEHAGLGDLYLSQLGPWHNMLEQGLSTWAERPEPSRSDCHAWSASPNYDLLTIVAGIRPGAPGFSRVLIAPHLAGLKHLEASMPTPKGMVRVAYKLEGTSWSATVTLPKGIAGDLAWEGRTYTLHEGTQTITLQAISGSSS
jgi:hypothetical protein